MPKAPIDRLLPFRASDAMDPAGVTLRVFCLPHAGGGASAFRTWVRQQPPGIEICPVQMPGREGRTDEPFAAGIAELAGALAPFLLPYLDVPYALVGNSMGALTAFELGRCFQQCYGLPPVRLVAASTRPPGTRLNLPPVTGLGDDAFIEAIQGRHGGIPDDILRSPEHRSLFLPALRADMAVFETYQPAPEPRLACPITTVAGADDPGLTLPELAGWADFHDGATDAVELPGDHFALLSHRDAVLAPLEAEAALP